MGTHFKDSPPKTTEEAVAHVEKRDIAHRTGKQAKVTPHVDEELYKKMYAESINEPDKFWDKVRPPSPLFGRNLTLAVSLRWPRTLSTGTSPTALFNTVALNMAT
jgi:hypothetical protein